MSYKIAVASSDGKVINQHFGRATKFLVFQVDESGYKYLELIDADAFCNHGEHNENKLLSAVDALKRCRAVIVSQIGSGAAEALGSVGIDPVEVHDFIENAIKKLSVYYSKIDKVY